MRNPEQGFVSRLDLNLSTSPGGWQHRRIRGMKRTNLNNHELINYQDLTKHFFISKTQGKIYQTE